MNWLINNWSLLVVLMCTIVIGVLVVKSFIERPTDQQITQIKQWLLYAVIEAEAVFQSGTGALKLRYVYDMFLQRFPSISAFISFEMFSLWVDEVLVEMKHLLETNKSINTYVEDYK